MCWDKQRTTKYCVPITPGLLVIQQNPTFKEPHLELSHFLREVTIFMSYMGPVCQVSGHQKSICPVLTVGEKVMVPFKVKEKS